MYEHILLFRVSWIPLIGRQQQVERVTHILCKRKKSNPCLIGDPRVGKTVIAEGLAQAIVKAEVPKNFRELKVRSLKKRTQQKSEQ